MSDYPWRGRDGSVGVGTVVTVVLLACSLVSVVLSATGDDGWRRTVALIVIALFVLFAGREAVVWVRRRER